MSWNEIKKAVQETADAFAEFKKSNDEAIKELKDRLETMEAQRKQPGRTGTGGKDAKGGLLYRMATNEQLLAGLKSGTPVVVEFKCTLREVLDAVREYESKTILTGDGAGSPGASWPVEPIRLPGVFNDPRRPIRLLDVLPRQPTGAGNTFQYVRLSSAYTPTAAIQQAEGADKAEATVNGDLQNGTLVTIANHLPASTQVLSDVPSLQRYIFGLLRQAVLLKLENEIVNGPSSQITGIMEVATAATGITATSAVDKIGQVKVGLESVGWVPDVVILNPVDEFAIVSERATGGDGQYVNGGGAYSPATGKLWKTLEPVSTPVLAQGTAVVLDSTQVSIFDREELNLRLGFVGNQFTQNLVTLLVEGRYGFAVLGPSAVRKQAI